MEITMVRVYMKEADKMLNAIIRYLHFDAEVHGVTVLKAVAGYGKSGAMHDLATDMTKHDLPLVLEFFDEDEKIVQKAIEGLKQMVGADHVIAWKAWIPN